MTPPYDPADPSPWLALALDDTTPFTASAKTAYLKDQQRWSRRYLFHLIRPVVRVLFVLIRLVRMLLPGAPDGNAALHGFIHWGLKTFVTPEANALVLRHFHVGTEVLEFLQANAGPVEIDIPPLRPTKLADLKANLFLLHDLNVFNLIIQLNQSLAAQGRRLSKPAVLDLSMISDDFGLEALPDGPLNIIDLQTAIEVYTVMYALFLPKAAFERASHSLQFDETFAAYVGVILDEPRAMGLVRNRGPLTAMTTLGTADRVMLHGVDAEALHGALVRLKQAQTMRSAA
ncbi:MAG: hypothetical protein Q7T61_12530 [Caulobacter sp.]|nr:hypothetical protein [Caulobacter sp.]